MGKMINMLIVMLKISDLLVRYSCRGIANDGTGGRLPPRTLKVGRGRKKLGRERKGNRKKEIDE